MMRLDAYFHVTEAAAFLGVSPNTLRNWGREEKIREYRHPVNNYRLYKRQDLQRLLRMASAAATKRPRTRKQRML